MESKEQRFDDMFSAIEANNANMKLKQKTVVDER